MRTKRQFLRKHRPASAGWSLSQHPHETMSCVLEKLKAFEDAVLGEAKYVDKFDALSISTVLFDEVRAQLSVQRPLSSP